MSGELRINPNPKSEDEQRRNFQKISLMVGDNTNAIGFKLHGDDADASRPEGYGCIFWIGGADPNNAEDGDVWIELS